MLFDDAVVVEDDEDERDADDAPADDDDDVGKCSDEIICAGKSVITSRVLTPARVAALRLYAVKGT